MLPKLGMNVDQAMFAADRMEKVANSFMAEAQSLERDIISAQWTGDNANRFWERWGEFRSKLRMIQNELHTSAGHLREAAHRQDAESSVR